MNILFITRKYPPSVGGMEKVCYGLYAALSKKASVEKISWGYSQVYLPFFIIRCILQAGVNFFIFRKKYSLICVGDALLSPLALLLKKLSKVRVVSIVHGLDITFGLSLYQRIVPFCLKRLDLIICVSSYTKDECVSRGIPGNKLVVIPNGISACSVVSRQEALMRLREEGVAFAPNAQILLTVARLIKRKGIPEFIEQVYLALLKKYPQLVYIVAGEGPQRSAIEQLISMHNLQNRLILTGRVSSEVLRWLYSAADIFIMPNIKVEGDVEGFGIVALEASSCGIPSVAFQLQGIPDAVSEGENGLLVPYPQYDVFNERLSLLLSDDTLRKSLSRKAREFSGRFSWDEIGNSYLHAMEQIAIR